MPLRETLWYEHILLRSDERIALHWTDAEFMI